jgi:hypothetical protein
VMATTVDTRSESSRPARHVRPRELDASGRRSLSAGGVIVAVVVALAVGAVLAAPGLRRTAQIQDPGWKREAGLALTEPLAAGSSFLHLDDPRHALKVALGRGDDDVVDTAVVFSPPPAPAPPAAAPPRRLALPRHAVEKAAPAAPPAALPRHAVEKAAPAAPPAAAAVRPKPVKPARPEKPAFGPHHRLRLWVAGDSLSITSGWAIVRLANASKAIQPLLPVDGRVATGLTRPDVFNWFRHIRDQLRQLDPKAVVLTFGANDDHSFMTGVPDGTSVGPFGSASWVKEYRRRVAGLMKEITAQGRFLVWIGLPITRSGAQAARFRLLDRIYRSEAEKRSGRVAYIDTYALFADPRGGYSDYLRERGGTLTKMRASDGVHYERAGGDRVARVTLVNLRRAFDLTSWKRKARRG